MKLKKQDKKHLYIKKMNNISMSRISPKLIDVQGNRIPFVDQKDKDSIGWVSGIEGNPISNNMTMNPSITLAKNYSLDNGRFPTQLFTSIKNDRYKYVKHIS